MPTSAQNTQLRNAEMGFLVARPTGLVAQALTSMFTISGGRILVKALYAKLTIASDASNATTITVGYTASEGAGVSLPAALASSSVVGVVREIGTHWTLATTVAGALQIGATAGTPLGRGPDILLGPGAITYTGGVGVNPGSAAWYLLYTPLDSGANVVAA